MINEGSELEDFAIKNYECDFCEFGSVHLNGLKVHIARKHKIKCDECRITFQDDDCKNRHMETEQILENIGGKKKNGMQLKCFKLDEKCLGIFDSEKFELSPLIRGMKYHI